MIRKTHIVGPSALLFLTLASTAQVRTITFDDIRAGEIGDQYMPRGVRFLHGDGSCGTTTGPLYTDGVAHSAFVGNFGTSVSQPNVLIPTPSTNDDIWVYFYNSRGERTTVSMVGVTNDFENQPHHVYLDTFDEEGTWQVRWLLDGAGQSARIDYLGIAAVRICAGPLQIGYLGVDDFVFCAPLELTGQPPELMSCDHGVTSFGVDVFGGDASYLWQIMGVKSETWTDLKIDGQLIVDGLDVGLVIGAGTPRVTLFSTGVDGSAFQSSIRVIVSNDCATQISDPASFRLCPADYNCDGGTDGEDINVFMADWESGLPGSDFNADGGVDGADVVLFFARWENGC